MAVCELVEKKRCAYFSREKCTSRVIKLVQINVSMLHLATQSHIKSNTPLSQLLWCSNPKFLIHASTIHLNKLKC